MLAGGVGTRKKSIVNRKQYTAVELFQCFVGWMLQGVTFV